MKTCPLFNHLQNTLQAKVQQITPPGKNPSRRKRKPGLEDFQLLPEGGQVGEMCVSTYPCSEHLTLSGPLLPTE